ncbi:MAG: peptidylprolyl isomerase [Planctomycetes bacterium]|nr:peptidylprolyl isomerase [Planctomycetota bacterium]
MAAVVQGLLTRGTLRGAGLAALVLAGCAGGPPRREAKPAVAVRDDAAALPAVAVVPGVQDPAPADLGPEILLPKGDEPDAEIARIGDLVLRRSHAYARLLTAHPKLALSAVDLLVFDVLVARHAQQFGIRVDAARVEALAAAEERAIAQQVAVELGRDMDLATYVWRLFGMRLSDWRQTLRVRTAQRLYQGYVIRYLALREDRVQVRFLVHKDPKVVQEVVDKVRAGADFATLALRHSEDPTRRDGGMLPPFGRGFRHPIVAAAFTLQPGEVSAPFEAQHGDEARWFAVYCLAQMPGRDVPFAAVGDEIDRDLVERPLTELETNAYTLRWRPGLEAPPK